MMRSLCREAVRIAHRKERRRRPTGLDDCWSCILLLPNSRSNSVGKNVRFLGSLSRSGYPSVVDASLLSPHSSSQRIAAAFGGNTEALNQWLHLSWLDALQEKNSKVCRSSDILACLATYQMRPNSTTFRLLIEGTRLHAAVRMTNPLARAELLDDLAKQLLVHFQKEVDSLKHQRSEQEDVLESIHKVMTAWVQANRVKQAEWWLHQLEKDPRIKPTYDTYTIVLAGWAKHRVPQKAEAILERMQRQPQVRITRSNFESCLNAWMAGNAAAAGPRCEILVLQMNDLYWAGKLDQPPGLSTMVKVVRAWVEGKSRGAAGRAHGVLRLLLELLATDKLEVSSREKDDTLLVADAYLYVMKAWSLSKDAKSLLKTFELWRELQEYMTAQGHPVLPQNVTQKLFHHLMTALMRSNTPKNRDRAERIAKELSSTQGLVWDRPACNAILSVYAKTGDGRCAEQFLRQVMLDELSCCEPDTKSFNSVLLAWSKSDDANARAKAEELFLEMRKRSNKSTDQLPDVVTYNALLAALAGTTDIETALRGEQYFLELKRFYKETGNNLCRPSAVTYTKAISLWSHVSRPEALERAQAILDEMLARVDRGERHLEPTVSTYNAFMRVLKRSCAPDKADRIRRIEDAIKAL